MHLQYWGTGMAAPRLSLKVDGALLSELGGRPSSGLFLKFIFSVCASPWKVQWYLSEVTRVECELFAPILCLDSLDGEPMSEVTVKSFGANPGDLCFCSHSLYKSSYLYRTPSYING